MLVIVTSMFYLGLFMGSCFDRRGLHHTFNNLPVLVRIEDRL